MCEELMKVYKKVKSRGIEKLVLFQHRSHWSFSIIITILQATQSLAYYKLHQPPI